MRFGPTPARDTPGVPGTGTTAPVRPLQLHRRTLDNGLRVLLAPDRGASAVGIAVHYDVGMRSEPAGRSGFAHLFEHLMFQGSANLPKSEHFRYVESSGGMFNGSTHRDYTEYFEILPSNALERGLFLEADRMRAPLLSEPNLRVQIGVVKEEIRVKVRNSPYGGFPWLHLPATLFDSYANTHDGYGSFEDLETATVGDARSFFDRYYCPGNALLCLTGGFDVEEADNLVRRHFDDIPGRPAPVRPDFAEPPLAAERRATHLDPHAPIPAVAAGWRVPDPVDGWAEYLPYVVLTALMAGGDSTRLERRLVRQDRIVTQQNCYVGLLGDPYDVRDPTELIVQARHAPTTSADTVLAVIDEEFRRIADDGLADGELDRTLLRTGSKWLRRIASVLGRTESLAAFELQHGRAELLVELPAQLAAVTGDQVRAAAATLTPSRRGAVELRPGGRRGGED